MCKMPTVTDICKLYGNIKPSKVPKIWSTINKILIEHGNVNIICCTHNYILTEILRAARNEYIIPTELFVVTKKHIHEPNTKTLYINCIGTFKKTIQFI